MTQDEIFMRKALDEAQKALAAGEVPIGAVIVAQDKVIGRGHNLTETLHDVTAHAEMQAITAATEYLGGKYLTDCTLYVTVEPCVMCAGAIGWSQLSREPVTQNVVIRLMHQEPFILRPKSLKVYWKRNVLNL